MWLFESRTKENDRLDGDERTAVFERNVIEI